MRPRLHRLRQISRDASIRERKFTNKHFKIKAEKPTLRGGDKKWDAKRGDPILTQCMLVPVLQTHLHVFRSHSHIFAQNFSHSHRLPFWPEAPAFTSTSLILASSATPPTVELPQITVPRINTFLLLIHGSLTFKTSISFISTYYSEETGITFCRCYFDWSMAWDLITHAIIYCRVILIIEKHNTSWHF